MTSLASPRAQATLAQSRRIASAHPSILENCVATAGQGSVEPAEKRA